MAKGSEGMDDATQGECGMSGHLRWVRRVRFGGAATILTTRGRMVNCGVCAARQEGDGRIGSLDKWPKFQCRSGLERDHMFLTAAGQLIGKTDEADA